MPEATAQQRLAISLQAALTEAGVTRAFLLCSPALIGARGRAFYRLDPLSGDPSSVVADVSADFLQDYEERGRQGDPVLDFARAHLRPIDDTGACSVRDWERSPVHDVLRQAGFYHSMEAPVIASGAFIGTINFARARGDRPFSAADMAAAQTAAEQVGLGVERARRFEQRGERASMLEAALDRVPQAVVLTDSEGGVVYANRSATRPDAQGGSLLERAAPRIAQDLASIFDGTKRVLVGSGSPDGRPRTENGGPADRVTVKSVPLPGDHGVMMTLIYPAAGGNGRLPLWDVLTPREQQIAEWVSQGLTTRQIADRAVVTENTVKQHLKRIFVKADVTNRAELVQRIWTSRRSAPLLPPGGQRKVPVRGLHRTARRLYARQVYTLHQLLWELRRDPGLAERFRSDPDGVLADYDLAPADRTALAARDFRALYDRGANPYLLYFCALQIGVSRQDYYAQLRREQPWPS